MTIRKRRTIHAALGVFCLGLLVTASALVAQRDSHWAALDIDPEWTNFRSFVTHVNLGVDNEAWATFENQYGNDFVSQWDFRSGVPHLIYGPGIDTGLTNPDEAQATAVAYDLMTEHNELFRLRDFDMDPYVSHVGNTWYVDMYFYHETIPFDEHSRFAIRLKDNGVIAAIKTYDIPDEIEPSQPTTESGDAVRKVMASIVDRSHSELNVSDPELWYLVDGYGVARLVWRFEIRNEDKTDPFGKEYFVHALENMQVFKINELIHYDHSGDVAATVQLEGPYDGTTNDVPLENARVTITAGGSGSTFTDANGDFNFSGSGSRTIRSRLDGLWSNVNNQAGGDISQSITASDGDNFHFNHNSVAEFQLAQQDAYYWTNLTHDWSSAVMGNNGLEFELPTNVNLSGSCNAFWDGSSINFYRAGGGCPNMAFADVVAHEYGHGIDAGRGGILDGGYSEGFGDACATHLTNQSCVGRGFFGEGTCLRDAKTVYLWPNPACGGGVHCNGHVYSGKAWTMAKGFVAVYGEQPGLAMSTAIILAAAVANPADIPDAVFEHFIADDDNGNLSDGTPNYTILADAAESRNLPYPLISDASFTYPDGLPDILSQGGSTFRVNVAPLASNPIDGTGRIVFRLNEGPWVSLPMASIGVNQYEASIPSMNCFDVYDFYVEVDTDSGRVASDPIDAPDGFYTAIVADEQTTVLDDNFQTDTGWTVVNENLSTGAWQRAVPVNAGRSDPPSDFDGSGACYVTDNGVDADVDGGPTRLISPTLDMTGGGIVSFAYWHATDSDIFRAEISNNNGASYTTLFAQNSGAGGWATRSFRVDDFVTPTNTMRVRFTVSDNPNDSVTESAVDAFRAVRLNCTPPPVLPRLFLNPDPTIAGETATVFVADLQPNTPVRIYYARGIIDEGMGICPPELGGLCLDIVATAGSVKSLGLTSSANGQAQRSRNVPPSYVGRTIVLQAANVLGAGGSESTLSNTIERVIQ